MRTATLFAIVALAGCAQAPEPAAIAPIPPPAVVALPPTPPAPPAPRAPPPKVVYVEKPVYVPAPAPPPKIVYVEKPVALPAPPPIIEPPISPTRAEQVSTPGIVPSVPYAKPATVPVRQTVATAPPMKQQGPCKGQPEAVCKSAAACTWTTGHVAANGTRVAPYCKAKPAR